MAPTTAQLADGSHQALPAEGARNISNWVDKNATTLTIITNCFENHIVPHVQSCSTVHQAWITLTSVFESQDVITKMHLKDKLHTLKMKENESIIKHIHKFKSCLEQLLAAGITIQDDEAIITLMRSLPQSYTTFIRSYRR